jgi:hypothetical protein
MRFTPIRRAAVALAAAGAATLAAAGPAHAFFPDPVRLTDSQVDFGDSTFVLGAPIGPGSVTWSVVGGFYTPRLVGTLHLDNADDVYARMHLDYYDGAGGYLYTQHGGTVQASGMGHQSWSVNISPSTPLQIVRVRVCTETSTDGVNFSQQGCTGQLIMN